MSLAPLAAACGGMYSMSIDLAIIINLIQKNYLCSSKRHVQWKHGAERSEAGWDLAGEGGGRGRNEARRCRSSNALRRQN